MSALSAMAIIGIIYAAGDYVSHKTRAVCSMIFVSGIIFMVGFWVGLPKTLFQDSQLIPVAMAFISVLMVHMGSLMNLKELVAQWKTVIIALAAICAAAAALYFLAAPIIGREYALAAAGPVSGGVVATLIMSEAAKAKGLEVISVFLTMLLVLQNFVGIPIASWCLIREARRLKASGAMPVEETSEAATVRRLVPPSPKPLQTPNILMAITFSVAWAAVKLAGLTGGVVHPFVMALLAGILCRELGIVEPKVMDRANAGGLLLFVIMVPIFMSLDKATPAMVAHLIVPIVVAFAAAVAGIVAISWPMSRLTGQSMALTVALGVPCLFGFPATYIVAHEVASEEGKTEEEKAMILSALLPKMLISGFVSVTIASVILAGFLVRFM